MIIVSQDKDAIINFDKILNLVVIENAIVSIGDIKETTGITIAEYKSNKRAKEVLIEIMKNYANAENYKHFNREITAEQLNNMQESLIYEMPKE